MRSRPAGLRWLAAFGLLISSRPTTAQTLSGADGCTPHALVRLPVRDDGGVLSVPARLDGRAVAMVLDTGSEGGLVTPEAARLLSTDDTMAPPPLALPIQGASGGHALVRTVAIADLQLGDGADALHISLATVPVSRLPFQPVLVPPLAGLLGADLLSHFDIDLDLPHSRVTLYAPRGGLCPAGPSPETDPGTGPETGWSLPAVAVQLARVGQRLVAPVRLDQKPLTALVDTGARTRVVGVQAALGVGVDQAALGADSGGTSAGFGATLGFYRWHRFQSFTIAGHTERDVTLTVAPLDDIADMLLGADWFAWHEVWISWRDRAMWVAPPATTATR